MTTSLAEQLKRLAVPQTTLLKRDKKRASLLFDPKEAAGLRKETVYQIGLDGLEELIAKNEVFIQFKKTIFNFTSQEFERSVQSAESNKKLDKNIRKFLLLLSPYFLLNCSHKTLEWLIHRYHVQEYNREDLLMLIMPYHESNIFVRVVQLLKFKNTNDSWYFLKSLQKPGVHLTKQNLLNHAASDVYFLKFVSNFITNLIKVHEKTFLLNVAFNFYCTVYTGAIEYSQEINEAQISQILPLLIKGLNSNLPDFCAASYVVTARLLHKTTLTEAILDKFVEKLSQVKVENLKTEAILVLLILYQSQKHYQKVSEEAYLKLLRKEWLARILQDLNNSGNFISPFLLLLMQTGVQMAFKHDEKIHRNFVEKILKQVQFDQEYISDLLCGVLDNLNSKITHSKKLNAWLGNIFETIERQYPEQFDKVIYKLLTVSEDKVMRRRRKYFIIILQYTMTLKGKFTVFDKLYHPNVKYRQEALNFLLKNFQSLREEEKEVIQSSVIDRLKDDNISVVKEALNILKTVSVLKKDVLKPILINLSIKCQKILGKWYWIAKDVILLLCLISEANDWNTFLAIFLFLFPNSDEEIKIALLILKTSYAQRNPLLKNCKKQIQSVKNYKEFYEKIYNCLRSNGNMDIVKEFVEALQNISPENRDVLHKLTATLILDDILPNNCPFEVSALVVNIFEIYFTSSPIEATGSKNIEDFFNTARRGIYPIECFVRCLRNVFLKTQKSTTSLGTIDFSQNNEKSKFILLVINALLRGDNYSQNDLVLFLNHFCGNSNSNIEFLLNVSISDNLLLNSYFQITCLNYILYLLKDRKQFNLLKDKNDHIVPYTLILLLNKSQEIRTIGLKIIEKLLIKFRSYNLLLPGILRQKEEIVLDQEQIALIIFNILSPSNKMSEEIIDIRNNLVKTITDDPSCPIYLRAGVLSLLNHINTTEIFEQTSQSASKIICETKINELNENQSILVMKNIQRFTTSIANEIDYNTNIWNFLKLCIKNDTTKILIEEKRRICPAVLLFNNLDKEFFSNLKDYIEIEVLDLIIETVALTQNPDVLSAANRIFKHIDLNAKSIVNQLIKMRDVQSAKQQLTRSRRVSIIPTVDILDSLDWKKGITILEFIQSKKKIRNADCLVAILFDVLKKCLDFDEQAVLEYTKQLILSTILHFCLKLDKESLSQNSFNMDLIVQCVRASNNPQTHHHTLLVLAYAASFIPSQVLHNILAIFTFMGSSVLRHDDMYSYQIISKIIDTIIPILIEDNKFETIAKVLRVFVDALLDVPVHRRMPLYKQLLTKVDVNENLYLFLLLVFESHVVHNNSQEGKEGKEKLTKRLEIATDLCLEFSPAIVISNCIKLLKYLKELPDEKTNELESNGGYATFDIGRYTPKQFRHYKYTIITFIANLLSSKEFVTQVASLNDEELLDLEELFKNMIINILTYIQITARTAEKHSKTPQNQYWKIILHHSYDILDSTNALLTPQMFLLVIKGLMSHNLSTVKRRALELLNAKLQYNSTFFADCEQIEIYSLIPPLTSTIATIKNTDLEADQELIIQTALLSLKLFVKLLASQYPDKFVQILEFISDVIKCRKTDNNVLASVVLCLAELCVNLRAHAIPSLPNFMPAILKILKNQKFQESSLLLLSIIAAIQKILDTLPLFLSPYLGKLLYEMSLLSSKFGTNTEDQKLQVLINKLKNIQQKIGAVIPSRILIPIIEDCYNNLIEKNCFDAISPLMYTLMESITNLKGPEINSNLPELTNFFLNALQLRCDGNITHEQANLVEKEVVKAFTTLILKLSENTFRPLYYKLYDWAVRNEIKSERLITFYSLSSNIAECLKGLFVLFAGHFLNNAAQVLESCNTIKNEVLYFDDDKKNVLLLENVLKTLYAVFTYGNQKFINKDRFQVLMQPVLDQLENTLGGIECLEERNKNLITPCIVQFAVTTADDALWKQLNYQILLKMRHTSPHIRIIALQCLTEIVKKLGEDFLPLLPETVPFLAELLEDEEENVEKSCRTAVQEMEKILGESLQKYF